MSSTENTVTKQPSLFKKSLMILSLLIGMSAFLGMGVFMYNMGRDMSVMTTSVVQMSNDVHGMATNMDSMSANMLRMANSMAEGQKKWGMILPKWQRICV